MPLLPNSDCIVIVTSRHHLALHLDVPSAIEIKLGELPSEVHLNADPLAPSLWTRAHSFVVERCVVASRYAVHVEFAIRVHVRAGVAVGRIVWEVATCHSSRRRVHFPQASAGIEELKLTKDWRAHSVLAKQPNLRPETLIRKIAESKGSALLRYLDQEHVSRRQWKVY